MLLVTRTLKSLLVLAAAAASTSTWTSVPAVSAFSSPALVRAPSSRSSSGISLSSRPHQNNDCSPLPLTSRDLERMADMQRRTITIPIVILQETVLPGQSVPLIINSKPQRQLLEHARQESPQEIGILGLNPTTRLPLSTGVTAVIDKPSTAKNSSHLVASNVLQLHGQRQFHVLEEPFLDDTNSFYLANIQIAESSSRTTEHQRAQQLLQELPPKLQVKAQEYHHQIPLLVQTWYKVVQERWGTLQHRPANDAKHQLQSYQQLMGPMPTSWKDRAFWVAAMLHPSTNNNNNVFVSNTSRMDIRPAMISCRNDLERLLLARTALESSIQYMTE